MIKLTHRHLLTGMILAIPPLIAAASPARSGGEGGPVGEIPTPGMVLGVEALLLSGMGFARSQCARFEAEGAARSARPVAIRLDATPAVSTPAILGARRDARTPHSAMPARVHPPRHAP